MKRRVVVFFYTSIRKTAKTLTYLGTGLSDDDDDDDDDDDVDVFFG